MGCDRERSTSIPLYCDLAAPIWKRGRFPGPSSVSAIAEEETKTLSHQSLIKSSLTLEHLRNCGVDYNTAARGAGNIHLAKALKKLREKFFILNCRGAGKNEYIRSNFELPWGREQEPAELFTTTA